MKLLQKYSALVAIVFSLLISVSASAAETNPHEMVQRVADTVFTRLAKEQDKVQADKEYLRVIVEEELIPYVDYVYAAKKIIGRNFKKTTKEERSRFISTFKSYLIQTYASVFTLYKGQKVVFAPATPVAPNKKVVTVKTRIIDQGKPDIHIHFKVKRTKSGDWKAYDMVAEGISLLESKRAELGTLIRQQGLDKVSDLLAEKIKEPVQRKDTDESAS